MFYWSWNYLFSGYPILAMTRIRRGLWWILMYQCVSANVRIRFNFMVPCSERFDATIAHRSYISCVHKWIVVFYRVMCGYVWNWWEHHWIKCTNMYTVLVVDEYLRLFWGNYHVQWVKISFDKNMLKNALCYQCFYLIKVVKALDHLHSLQFIHRGNTI